MKLELIMRSNNPMYKINEKLGFRPVPFSLRLFKKN